MQRCTNLSQPGGRGPISIEGAPFQNGTRGGHIAISPKFYDNCVDKKRAINEFMKGMELLQRLLSYALVFLVGKCE